MHFYDGFTISVLLLIIVQFEKQLSLSAPLSKNNQRLTPEEKYLLEYGYLSPKFDQNNKNWEDEVKLSLMAFQTYASIPETGKMDDETLEMMQIPRCGNADIDRGTFHDIGNAVVVSVANNVNKTQKIDEKQSRRKRYVLEGSRWKIRNLVYNISKYPSSMPKEQVDRVIYSAFSLWERHANLVFHPADPHSRVLIDIRFEKLVHGDGDDFDGRGAITAHAFFPRSEFRGQIHFDDDEEWTVTSPWGTNLFQVAVHEIGHTLGLNHSDVHDSVMTPLYFRFKPGFQLHQDDINGIQALYGKKSRESTDLCNGPSIDAITTMVDGFTYIFKGPYVYQMDLRLRKLSQGYPKAISFEFPNLPERGIDAVFTRTNNISYFFKEDKVWRFRNMKMDSGFPKVISDFFEGIPSGLNAATTSSADEKIYFFKGSQYWKFDPAKTPPFDSRDYPRPLSDWKGIPEKGIDAAFRNDDPTLGAKTLFFRENQFWLVNEQTYSVEVADPPYPRDTSLWLYDGCNYT